MPTREPSPVFFCSAGREFEGEEEYLEILGITREQSGKYECKAANEVASADVKQVRVTVNCEYLAGEQSLPTGKGGCGVNGDVLQVHVKGSEMGGSYKALTVGWSLFFKYQNM